MNFSARLKSWHRVFWGEVLRLGNVDLPETGWFGWGGLRLGEGTEGVLGKGNDGLVDWRIGGLTEGGLSGGWRVWVSG